MPREWPKSKQTVPAKLYELEGFRIVNEAIASRTSPLVWPFFGSTVDLFRRGHVGRWLPQVFDAGHQRNVLKFAEPLANRLPNAGFCSGRSHNRARSALPTERPRQAPRDLDAVAGHDPARAGTATAAMRTLTGRRERAVGIVACLQTYGSRANWHPHLHLLVTDDGFRPDGTLLWWPAHDMARLTEAFHRAMLRLFVRCELFDEDQAAGMLTCPHSGFHVHTAVWVPEDDRAFATRLARYCAQNPIALERRT